MVPVRSQVASHAGLRSTSGANFSAFLTSIFSGIGGLPQSRRDANDQSSVMMRPLAPAARARSARARMVSRSPTQYIWKNVFGLAAATSSTGLLAKDDNPITMPSAAAARATATSPSGCTACTPVGEMSTGKERSWPMTVVDVSRFSGRSATCGRKYSSSKAASLSR